MARNTVYEPIKTPFSRKFHEFRLRYLPVIIFLIILGIVVALWNIRVYNPTFIGIVQGDVAHITAPETGTIRNMNVQPFDHIQEGEILAAIEFADSALVSARVSVLESQINLLNTGRDPLSNWQRNRIDYVGLRLDLMQERVAVATLELRQTQLSRNIERSRTLFENNLVSAQEFEDLELQLNLVNKEIAQRVEYIDDMEDLIEQVSETNVRYDSRSDDPVVAAIRVYEREIVALEEELKPIVIRAPFDGIVGQVFYTNGSNVPRGEIFMHVESQEAKRIVGYLRQPLTVRPQVGMTVQIRTRTPQKYVASATVNRIGARFVLIDNALQRHGVSMETGLPLEIGLTGLEGLPLLPGEIVDVIVR